VAALGAQVVGRLSRTRMLRRLSGSSTKSPLARRSPWLRPFAPALERANRESSAREPGLSNAIGQIWLLRVRVQLAEWDRARETVRRGKGRRLLKLPDASFIRIVQRIPNLPARGPRSAAAEMAQHPDRLIPSATQPVATLTHRAKRQPGQSCLPAAREYMWRALLTRSVPTV